MTRIVFTGEGDRIKKMQGRVFYSPGSVRDCE
jgi:hypothetical protein